MNDEEHERRRSGGRREDDLSPHRLELLILELRREVKELAKDVDAIKEDYVPRTEHVQNKQLQIMIAVGVLSPLINILVVVLSHATK